MDGHGKQAAQNDGIQGVRIRTRLLLMALAATGLLAGCASPPTLQPGIRGFTLLDGNVPVSAPFQGKALRMAVVECEGPDAVSMGADESVIRLESIRARLSLDLKDFCKQAGMADAIMYVSRGKLAECGGAQGLAKTYGLDLVVQPVLSEFQCVVLATNATKPRQLAPIGSLLMAGNVLAIRPDGARTESGAFHVAKEFPVVEKTWDRSDRGIGSSIPPLLAEATRQMGQVLAETLAKNPVEPSGAAKEPLSDLFAERKLTLHIQGGKFGFNESTGKSMLSGLFSVVGGANTTQIRGEGNPSEIDFVIDGKLFVKPGKLISRHEVEEKKKGGRAYTCRFEDTLEFGIPYEVKQVRFIEGAVSPATRSWLTHEPADQDFKGECFYDGLNASGWNALEAIWLKVPSAENTFYLKRTPIEKKSVSKGGTGLSGVKQGDTTTIYYEPDWSVSTTPFAQ